MAFRIKNWSKFQHFKDRRPPWIKLYRDILDDPDWFALDGESAKTLVMLWLIASEDDGWLPDTKKLVFRLRTTEQEVLRVVDNLKPWLEEVNSRDIKVISDRYQDDAPEKRQRREETEKKEQFDAQARLSSLGVSSEVLRDWMALRKAKKAAVTETVVAGVQREAGKAGISVHEALKMCCERNWQGFKAEWLTEKGRMNGHSPDNSPFA